MKGLLCFIYILSAILIGCLFLNKDVEAFTPYRNEPSHYQTVYESNSSYPKSSLDITGWSYQPSVDDVN
ncbi:hypothetical protein IIV6-T1_114 [Invertebrate iridescent virus 6]|nr:hypothetical protein IIV6-T1_114 [Invertebrate iridescent virus 6]